MLELPKLSLVITVHDASHQVRRVVAEASSALRHAAGLEFIIIDDACGENPEGELAQLAADDSRVRLYRQHASVGADAALWQAGTLATGSWVATLDPQGHDDPHDIPDMLCQAQHQGLTLIEGIPLDPKNRWKRGVFRVVRKMGVELADSERVGLRLIQRDALSLLPCVDRLHRFLPLLIRRSGGHVGSYRVNLRNVPEASRVSAWHAPARMAGYTRDWLGMWWLSRRWHSQLVSGKGRTGGYAR